MAVQYLTNFGRQRLLQMVVLLFIVLFILLLPSSTLRKLYASTDYRPVWVEDKGPGHRANSFLRCLKNGYRDGLNPQDYHLQTLESLWKERISERLAQLELLLRSFCSTHTICIRVG